MRQEHPLVRLALGKVDIAVALSNRIEYHGILVLCFVESMGNCIDPQGLECPVKKRKTSKYQPIVS